MQDRFVGDIGDFGKYGLLRALTGIWPPLPPEDRLSLGVVWYRNEDAKGGPNEGQNVGYLFDPQNAPAYSDLDPELYACLKEIVYIRRNVDEIEASNILGENKGEVIFHEQFVPNKQNERENWFKNALDCVTGKDVVFLDPDTGILPKSYQEKRKYICPSEVKRIMNLDRRPTIIAYQHYGRDQKGREGQVNRWRDLVDGMQEHHRILGTSQRAFIILPAGDHSKRIDDRLRELTQRWSKHFIQLAL